MRMWRRAGFEKGPLGSRLGSCEHGTISGDKHLLWQHSQKTSGGQARRGTGRSVITNTQGYIFLFRNCKVIVSRMWMIQKRWSTAVVCTVLGRCVFLANLILGSEHIRINMVKVCWGASGSPVLATIYRPPTKCKVHTWIIKCWLYWKHKKKWLSWTFGKEGGNPVNCSDSCLCFRGLENHGEKSENVGGVMMMKSRIRKLQ